MSESAKAKADLWLFLSEKKHVADVLGRFHLNEYRKFAEEIEYFPAIVAVEY